MFIAFFYLYFSGDEVHNESEGNVLIGNDGKVVERKCVFCGKSRKQSHGRELKISVSTDYKQKDKMKDNATKANDQLMLDYLSGLGNEDPIYFHHPCKTKYYKNYSLASQLALHGQWHISREIYKRTYDEIYLMVSEIVIKNRGLLLLQYLVSCARALLEKEYNAAFGAYDSIITAHKLQGKLVTHFSPEIQIFTVGKEK